VAEFTINIDLDRECKRCGKGGATDSGYCITCITKRIREGKYNHILKPGKSPLRSAAEMAKEGGERKDV
jgi:hypothetical protein